MEKDQESSHELFVEQIYTISPPMDSRLGIFDQEYVYFPKEKLNFALTEDVSLSYVKAITKDQQEEIIKLGSSGMALKKNILDIMSIIRRSTLIHPSFNDHQQGTYTAIQEHYGIIPTDPTESDR